MHKSAFELRRRFCDENSLDVAASLLNMGNVYLETYQLDSAAWCLNRARNLFENKLGKEDASLAPVYNSLGQVSRDQNNLKNAGTNFRKAFRIARKNWGDSPRNRTPYTRSLANYLMDINQPDTAHWLLQNLLGELSPMEGANQSLLAELQNDLGCLFAKKKEVKPALFHFEAAISYYNQLEILPERSFANSLQNKGLVLLEIGDIERAIRHFEAALGYLNVYPLHQAVVYQNLGLAYIYANEKLKSRNRFF